MSLEKNFEKNKDIELLEELGRRGYTSTKIDIIEDAEYRFPEPMTPFEIGVVSDTHLGSQYQQITFLKDFYRKCAERKIRKILHAGDLVEGNGKQYRGQMYEMFIHGADAMVKYAVNNYPKEKGITSYVIGGSHDESYWKNEGYDILKAISGQRKDIKYLGMHGAYLKLGNINVYLMHGTSGVAYARSYKMQKIIEQISPQNKPHILLLGHYHVANHLPMYRNVEGFQLGCFQSQTPYLRAKGLYPTLSALILRIYRNKNGLTALKTTWQYYHIPIEHDY